MLRTQILITDVADEKFSHGWPQELEKELFERTYPNIVPDFYSPLPFLHRIVIILHTDEEAEIIHDYLKKYLEEDLNKQNYKIYRTESLISRPRARSMNDVGADLGEDGRPVLKIDTSASGSSTSVRDILQESIATHSTLSSPDQPISPTRLRLQDGQKEYFYMEPPPSKVKSGYRQMVDGIEPSFEQTTIKDGSSDQEGPDQRTRSPSITVTNAFA